MRILRESKGAVEEEGWRNWEAWVMGLGLRLFLQPPHWIPSPLLLKWPHGSAGTQRRDHSCCSQPRELHLIHAVAAYQWRKTFRWNMAMNCSEMCLNISWIAVLLPMKATVIFRPWGGMSQTAILTLLGTWACFSWHSIYALWKILSTPVPWITLC